MSTQFLFEGHHVLLDHPIDISIAINGTSHQVNAFYIPMAHMTPLRAGTFVGSVAEGGSANCFNIALNPHGNGTHTECVGHISNEHDSVNQALKKFLMLARLVTVTPEKRNPDSVISLRSLQQQLPDNRNKKEEAVIIRSFPNAVEKIYNNYSGQNPTFFEADAVEWLCQQGYEHLLTDLPSVDREEDGGALAAHHAWWQYPNQTRKQATITELIYVPDSVVDGLYLLNLQVAPLECDASPSRPVLYRLES